MKKELIKIGDKTYKECMVIMLPTTQETNITKSITSGYLYHSSTLEKAKLHFKHEGATYQHLYIVSSEEIKEEDYCIDTDNKPFHTNTPLKAKITQVKKCPKIIASTDSSLTIKRVVSIPQRKGLINHYFTSKPLPRLSDDFLSKYCELNGEIKDVLVEYQIEYYEPLSGNTITSACHPPFPADNIDLSKIGMKRYKLKVAQDNTISIIKKPEDKLYTKDEVINLIKSFADDCEKDKELTYYNGRNGAGEKVWKGTNLEDWIKENL